MTYILLTALAVSTYFWFRNRAELSAMGDLYVNKCWDYEAAMAVNGELQAELDAVSESLEAELALRFEREFYGVDTVGEAAALAQGYTYDSDGELILESDRLDKLAWTAQDSTNEHIFYC
jgi:hypothetical protein